MSNKGAKSISSSESNDNSRGENYPSVGQEDKNSAEVSVAPVLGKVTGAQNLDQWHPFVVHA